MFSNIRRGLYRQLVKGFVMMNPFSEEKIFSIVQKVLANILDRDPAEITVESSLVGDLDADSLDFVEFRYTVEQELGIVLSQKSVLEHLEAIVGAEQTYENGAITELAADILRRSLFQYTDDQAKAGMKPFEIMAATTAGNWAACCHALFDHLPAHCPDCDGTEAKVSATGKAACAGCGVTLKPKTGDEVIAAAMPGLLATSPCLLQTA
jgi:acyl carrier protein